MNDPSLTVPKYLSHYSFDVVLSTDFNPLKPYS